MNTKYKLYLFAIGTFLINCTSFVQPLYSISPINSKYNSSVYDKSSGVNIEIFVSYLVSKLRELNISPSDSAKALIVYHPNLD